VGSEGQSQRLNVPQSEPWALNPDVPPEMLGTLQALQGSVSATDLHAFLRPSGTLSRQQIRQREDVRGRYSDHWIQDYAATDATAKEMDRILSDFQNSHPSTSTLTPALMEASFMRTEAVLEVSRACRTRSDVSRALDDWLDAMEDLDEQFKPPFTAHYSASTAPPSGWSDEEDGFDMQIVPYGRNVSSGGAAGTSTSSSARFAHYSTR
jgi:hypothetical protein